MKSDRPVMQNANRSQLLQHLYELEVKLHQADVRSDPLQLDLLLHPSFFEIGRSGNSFTKADILKSLSLETSSDTILSQGFSLNTIAEGVELLNYKSARINTQGEISAFTSRSSIWQLAAGNWQMRFHQGTPTSIFTIAQNI